MGKYVVIILVVAIERNEKVVCGAQLS